MYVLAKLDLHESNYMNHQAGALADELWDAWVRTLSDDFKFKEYRECWPIVKHHYAASFEKFVDDKIMPVVAWDAVGDSPGP